jgi:chromate reductase, NAD(P)H dehydrogenase (quinone)
MSIQILGIFGSMRQESSNRGLVKLAQKLAPTPAVVQQWRELVRQADALFIAAPEYNFGPTAVLKNAIDWASRPMGQHVLSGKVISLISSSGGTGGAHMIEQLSGILGLLGNTVITEPNGQIAKGAARIASDGSTTDPSIEALVRERLQALIATVQSTRQ